MRKALLALLALGLMLGSAQAQGWAEKMFKGGLTHDFGTVPRGAQMKHRFTITNIYAVRMEITSIKSGCGCVTATAAKRVLEPRESTTLEVHMDGRRFAGPKTVGVRVTVGPEYISSAELRITANSRSDIVFNPGEVSFGTVARGATPSRTIDVEYAGSLPFQVTEVIARGVPYTVAIKELYRRPGQVGYRLQATLKPDAPAGALKHEIFLKTTDPASPLVPVLIEANVLAPVTAVPATLSLGAIKSDTAHTRRVVVRGQKPFRLLAVTGAGPGIKVSTPLPTAEAEVHFLTLEVQPEKSGPFRHELKVKTSAQDEPVSVLVEGSTAP